MTQPYLAEPKSNTGRNILLGCGIGCAAVVVLLVIVSVGMWFMVRSGMDQVRQQMQTEYPAEYERKKAEGGIPESHAAEFDEIVQIIQQDNASMGAVMLGVAAIEATTADATIDDNDAEILSATLELLRNQPDIGFMGLGQFFAQHPEVQRAFQEIGQRYNVPADGANTPDPEAEPSVEPEPAV